MPAFIFKGSQPTDQDSVIDVRVAEVNAQGTRYERAATPSELAALIEEWTQRHAGEVIPETNAAALAFDAANRGNRGPA